MKNATTQARESLMTYGSKHGSARRGQAVAFALALLVATTGGACNESETPRTAPSNTDGGKNQQPAAPETAAPVPKPMLRDRPLATKGNIPVVFITSSVALKKNDETRVPGTIKIVTDHDGSHTGLESRPAAYEGPIGIKYRGSSSQNMPQLSYSVELWDAANMPVRKSLLGLPEDADWALVACYTDKHCMRNAMAYAMAREFGRWNPGLLFVEVYVDGKYNGLYQFIENIKTNKSRLDVPDPAKEGTGADITGTYVIRREAGGKGKPMGTPVYDWVSPVSPVPPETGMDMAGKEVLKKGHVTVYTYHEPSETKITAAQASYIKKHITDFETMMLGADWAHPKKGYPSWIDVDSWIDFALLNEVANNVDAYFKSMYIIKHRDVNGARGRLQMSPMWDFNIAFGNADYRDGWRVDNWIAAMNRFKGECTELIPLPEACAGNRNNCWGQPDQTAKGCWNTPYLPFYWDKLFDDVDFQDAMKCRWQALRKGPKGPFSSEFIDARVKEWSEHLKPAYGRQLMRWKELRRKVSPNPCEPAREDGLIGDKYTDKFKQPGLPHPACAPPDAPVDAFMKHEIDWFVQWTKKRIEFLDKNLPGVCSTK